MIASIEKFSSENWLSSNMNSFPPIVQIKFMVKTSLKRTLQFPWVTGLLACVVLALGSLRQGDDEFLVSQNYTGGAWLKVKMKLKKKKMKPQPSWTAGVNATWYGMATLGNILPVLGVKFETSVKLWN